MTLGSLGGGKTVKAEPILRAQLRFVLKSKWRGCRIQISLSVCAQELDGVGLADLWGFWPQAQEISD